MENTTSSENPSPKIYTYATNTTRTSLTLFLFWIFIALSAITPIIGVYASIKYNIAMREQTDEAKRIFLQVAQNYYTASGWTGIVFILCAIAFSFWIYRASANTHAFNPQTKIEFSPGWCIGCYLIPFVNLYWPYKSMKELWVLNLKNKTDSILSWWITYLIFNFTANVASKLSARNNIDISAYILSDTASNIFGIISAIIAIKIITSINKAQVNNAMAEKDKR